MIGIGLTHTQISGIQFSGFLTEYQSLRNYADY